MRELINNDPITRSQAIQAFLAALVAVVAIYFVIRTLVDRFDL
jgi:hypothetical protein